VGGASFARRSEAKEAVPRPFMFLKQAFIAGYLFLPLLGCIRAGDAVPQGLLEGHLKIVSLKEVELAGANPSKGTSENYADYPLIILSKAEQKEVARVTADRDGNYRLSLPPGDYILDVQGRGRGRVRAKPQPFTVVSNQAVRVDMDMDTGVR
jgi:hypothetical protein